MIDILKIKKEVFLAVSDEVARSFYKKTNTKNLDIIKYSIVIGVINNHTMITGKEIGELLGLSEKHYKYAAILYDRILNSDKVYRGVDRGLEFAKLTNKLCHKLIPKDSIVKRGIKKNGTTPNL